MNENEPRTTEEVIEEMLGLTEDFDADFHFPEETQRWQELVGNMTKH